ncbi:unnamed protein product [Urochloa humidicola]
MAKAAVAAAAKGMISLSRARAAAAAAAARTAPRWIHSTGGEVGGAGPAWGAKAARTVTGGVHSSIDKVGGAGAASGMDAARIMTRQVHSSTDKRDFEKALFEHKLHTKQLLHEQNMRIIKLQGDFDITKKELEAAKFDLKHEVIKGETSMIYGFGVMFLVMLVFDLTRLS